jgi:hypothetical protein
MGQVGRAQDEVIGEAERILVDKLPSYWIGVHAIPVDDALKSHLQIEERLIVAHVVPDSPANKAGLRQHDIFLKFGNAKISSLKELISAVEAAEKKETSVTVLRSGKETKLSVSPTERPDNVIDLPVPERALKFWLGADDGWRRSRVLGPGLLLDRRVEELPDGLSINIKKENDEPAKITVKRGEDSWEVTEDSLDELPEDLREHVKRHLRQHNDRDASFFRIYGDKDGLFHLDRFAPEGGRDGLSRAIRRLEQLQQRFDKDDPFKAMQEQIEELRREIEKLQHDREEAADDAKPDEARDA